METQRTIVITGAATGIGAAVARRLAASPCRLILHTGSNRAALAGVADELRDRGNAVDEVVGDIAEEDTVAQLLAPAQAAGHLDGIVSNAGYADRTPYEALTPQQVLRAHAVMTMGFFELSRRALPLLEASGGGRIVAISSFVAHRYRLTGELFPASAAAKAGLEALAKDLALETAGRGITVNCVVPGHIEKDVQDEDARGKRRQNVGKLIPMGRLGVPDEIAGLVQFLLSDDAAYITGQTVHVDGGLTL
jgi:NAD(P)-dependent dehydrogenase (short-subunit alcohol dehydrogenase family)